MTDMLDDAVMQGHFKEAGIIDEPAATVETPAITETPDATIVTPEGTPAGTTPPTVDANGVAIKPDAAAKDSNSSGTNAGGKQGKEVKGPEPSGPKDLTLTDGTVIKSGPERRWYENMQIARQQADATRLTLSQRDQEITTLKAAAVAHEQAVQAMGATSPQNATTALRLYGDLQRDPLGTTTKLLAELKAAGHNVEGIGGAVDTLAIGQMITRQAQQGGEQQQSRVTPAQVAESARVETGQFFARYPDAVQHDSVLADIITKHPNVSLDDAYFQLKHAVVNQGFDWSQPLAAQVQARQAAATAAAGQQQGGKVALMVNGRVATAAAGDINPITNVNPDGETFEDIIRASMRETGYTSK